MIALYGLFERGVCVYVGATANIAQRLFAHTSPSGRFYGRSVALRVFRLCQFRDAARLEAQITRAYWRRGQANGSIVAGRYAGPLNTRAHYRLLPDGVEFERQEQIAQLLGCSRGTVEEDGVLGVAWFDALVSVKALLDGDGAVAMRLNRTTDSKDNGSCESVFGDALRIAGFDRNELGI